MNISFVSNYHKTIFFASVAGKLRKCGNKIFWMSPSRKWAKWLIAEGVYRRNILDITKYGKEWVGGELSQEDDEEIKWLEDKGELSVRDIIMRDRVLRYKNYEDAVKYISTVSRKVREFILKENIEVIFGEQTWAFEIVVGQVSSILDVRYLVPKSTRIPNGKFAFFPSPYQKRVIEVNEVESHHRSKANKLLKNFKKEKPKPDYYKAKGNLPSPNFQWLLKPFHANKDPYNETRFHWRDLKNYKSRDFNRVLRGFTVYLRRPFEVKGPPSDSFVFITLHRQPEASVDVLGGYFSNQLETVRAISRSTPNSYRILVKEHSSAIGDRGPNFYSKLSGIPGVSTVDPYVDSFPFLENSDLVVSISGTASYEAALLGQPATTVAPMFFGPLLVCNGWNPYNSSLEDMSEMLGSKAQLPCREDKINFLSYILAQSFSGIISDPTQSKECMSTENINKVSDGFRLLLDDL